MKNPNLILFLFIFLIIFLVGNSQTFIETVDNNPARFNFNSCIETNKIIHHQFYSLSYSEKAEQAEWVSYKLTSANFSQNIERTNDFREDLLVNQGSASLDDYRASGYDRGHLAPAGSMKMNEASMSESFFMSNMSPQSASFNRGVWKRLEGKVRYWSENNDSILVVSGPILDNPISTIGTNKVYVPRAFYKVLIGFKGQKVMGIGFLIPHEKSDQSLYSFATSIDAIEELTGIDFYCKIDASIQLIVEANRSVKKFIFKE